MKALKDRLRSEHGFTVAIIMWLLMIALLFGAAGLAETLDSRSLTTRDGRERRAQQAAEAGIQAQLYDTTEQNLGSTYNFSGGVLGLSGFLDCMPLQLDASARIGGLTAYASTSGVCPQALNSTGSATSYWSAVGNHAYYSSEFFSDKREVGNTGFGSVVEFPKILSIGCDTTGPSTCSSSPAPSSNLYARELALLAPTGPLQAIEGMGNVTIGGLKLALLGNVASVVNGDIMSGGTLTLPTLAPAVNTSWPATGILPTFGYTNTPAPASITTANLVHLSGFCSAGSPSNTCMIKRLVPTPSVTSCANCTSGITCSSCSGGGYNSSNDTFTITAGTATFAGGDYLFCNFSATGSATVKASPSSSTPVRIFILPPNVSPCSGNGYTKASGSWNGGNFTDTGSGGLANSLLGTVNGVTNTLDPSGLQIYVEGDGSYDNATSVTIGSSTQSSALTVGAIIYAPTSSVNVTTSACSINLLGICTLVGTLASSGGVFSGSIVGDNTSITAGVITQDLDIGNYPLYSGANAFRPVQYVQCPTSVTSLTASSSDTNGC
jgi:hypothetical protein